MILGSGELIRSLMAHNLIDRVHADDPSARARFRTAALRRGACRPRFGSSTACRRPPASSSPPRTGRPGEDPMKQYLLSIYQPDGDRTAPPELLEQVTARRRGAEPRAQGGRRVGVRGRSARPRAPRRWCDCRSGEVLMTDGPYAEGKEHIGGFIDHRGARPRRRARVGPASWPARRRCPIEVRPFQGEPSAACRPATTEIERVFREEYGRAVAVLVRVFGDIDIAEEAVQDAFVAAVQRWPSDGLPPSPAGWIITTARNRAIDRLRREASRDDRHAQAALLHARDEPLEEGPVQRRPAAPDLHVLPSGARRQRPGRADAAAARRADHGGDRARVPGARADDGAAAGAGEGQDPRRRHPVPRAERGRPAGAAARRAGGRLPDLQRGLHGELGRPSSCAAELCAEAIRLGRAAGRADARRAGGRSGCWR